VTGAAAKEYRFGEAVSEFVRLHCKEHNRKSHAHETECG
jgi:hypothetical protein